MPTINHERIAEISTALSRTMEIREMTASQAIDDLFGDGTFAKLASDLSNKLIEELGCCPVCEGKECSVKTFERCPYCHGKFNQSRTEKVPKKYKKVSEKKLEITQKQFDDFENVQKGGYFNALTGLHFNMLHPNSVKATGLSDEIHEAIMNKSYVIGEK